MFSFFISQRKNKKEYRLTKFKNYTMLKKKEGIL